MGSVPQRQTRFDPAKARRTYRKQREKGVWLYVTAVELERTGIDPDGPPPTFRAWPGSDGGMRLRFYP